MECSIRKSVSRLFGGFNVSVVRKNDIVRDRTTGKFGIVRDIDRQNAKIWVQFLGTGNHSAEESWLDVQEFRSQTGKELMI